MSHDRVSAAGSQARVQNSPLRQIRESTQALLALGKSEEAWELVLAALEAVLAKNRDQELLILQLRKQHLGRKSERIDPAQIQLMFEAMVEQPPSAPDAAVDAEAESREDARLDRAIEEAEAAQPKAPGKKRKKGAGWSAGNVEREVRYAEPNAADCSCAICHRPMKRIGEDITRRLRFEPGRFVEEETHMAKWACCDCKEGVVTAPAPPQVLERCAADASVLGHVVASKFVDHMPLHRLSRSFARMGVEIPVSTLSDWVAEVGDLIAPLVERLAGRVLQATIIRTDATGLLVLDPDSPDNVVRGSLWAYVGDDRDVLFRYAPTGEGQTGPWGFLAGRKGYIQADASNVFDRLFDGQVANAVELGCWAHARRKLVALEPTDCRVAYPLTLIARMYRVEHLADARRLVPEERAKLRQELTGPVLEKLLRWFTATCAAEPPSSDLAHACAYTLNHWFALTRFLADGRISLDNNLCEQQLRDIATGRKNYLFAGSHAAAERSARIYSLTRTCIQHKVAPFPYLTDVIAKLGTGAWSGDRLDELLPHVWRPAAR